MNRSSLRRAFLLIPLVLGCFALSPTARAVDPPPDGGYPNQNTAEGEDALFSLTTGVGNTAIGFKALYYNTTGYQNTANGAYALFSLTTGNSNTATGISALLNNTTGNNNTATGLGALPYNTTGYQNTANGDIALYNNTTGISNTANGFQALYSNTTGDKNIAVGFQAGLNLTTGSNNIDIGNTGAASEAGIIRIGTAGIQTATFISGIRETPLVHGAAVAVGITVDGQLGVRASSARFKEAIKPMDKASEAIFSLQPVTFRYKKALDPGALPQFGLVAEQVAKVDPDLVARDDQGKPFTVRYDEVNVMLLNEFLKAHRKLEEQARVNQQQEAINSRLESTVAQQQKEIQGLAASLKEQASQIQKVSAQLETSKPAPQTVVDNH